MLQGIVGGFGPLGIMSDGGISIDPALKASAQRIVDGYNAFVSRTTMGVAPTMTVGSTYGNTLIPGQFNNVEVPMILVDDPSQVRKTGPVRRANAGFLPSGMFGDWMTVNDGGPVYRDGGSGWGYGIKTVSRYVELCVNFSVAANSPWNVYMRVNGQWAKASDYVMFASGPGDNQPYPVRFDFGSTSAQPREIEFFLPYNGNIFGFNVVTGSAVTPATTTPVKMSAWSDSYGNGYAGLANIKSTCWQIMAERFGCTDLVPEALGGQGYVTQVNTRTILNRINDDVSKITGLDATFGHFSINDFLQTQSTVITNTVAGLTALQNALPASTWIGWFVAFPADNGNNSSRFAAYQAAVEAVAQPRTIIIPAPAFKLISTTGTLPNDAAHDSSDGTHPGQNECAYMGPWMADQFLTRMKTRAGIA